MRTADIGVFGGSGFYAFLDDPEEIVVDTPYGKPAADTGKTTSSPRTGSRTAQTSGR